MGTDRRLRAFAEGDAGGEPVHVRTREPAGPDDDGCVNALVEAAPDASGAWPIRFHAQGRPLRLSAAGALAVAATLAHDKSKLPVPLATGAGAAQVDREAGTWWLSPPRVQYLNWGQPAFAARSLRLDPLDLDSRFMPGVASVGVPYLVIPVDGVDALARACLELPRLRELMPRVGAEAVAAFTEAADGTLRMRAFPEAFGLPEGTGLGEAAGAVAAWLLDNDWFGTGRVDVDLLPGDPGAAPFRVRTRGAREPDGRPRVDVGGRVASTGRP